MRKRRVLIFDDEEIILYLFKDFFSTLGYEVLTFAEPVVCPIYHHDAGACPQQSPCADVLIVDFHMPRMNGMELLERQAKRGCKLTARNKAIITGYIDEEDHKRIEALGYAFFQKPVDFSDLTNWLTACEKRVDLSQPLASRRTQERQPANHEIMCSVGSGAPLQASVVDISSSGLCMRIKSPLVVGQKLRINADLPNTCFTARVVWVVRNEEGYSIAGLVCTEADQGR